MSKNTLPAPATVISAIATAGPVASPASATDTPAATAPPTTAGASRRAPMSTTVNNAPTTPPTPIAELSSPGPASDMSSRSRARTTSRMSSIPSSMYSAATRPVSNRAAGSRSTARTEDDVRSSAAGPTRGTPAPSPTAHHHDSALQTPMATSTPPGAHHAVTTLLTSGPIRIPAASADPDPALPAVSSLVVSEISGSSVLWTGLVRLMATVLAAASTQTSTNGASSSIAAPAAAVVTAWAAYPSRSARGAGSRPSQAAAGDANRAVGTSWATAMTLAPRTPSTA